MIDYKLINIGLKLLMIAILCLILFQDIKERMVYWFFYPLIGVVGAFVQLFYLPKEVFLFYTVVNLMIVFFVLFISWIYISKIKKQKYLNESIGLGDILFFCFLSFCFPTTSFVILFVFSLFFSLIIFQFVHKKNNSDSVPLAGLMALFYVLIYTSSIFIFEELIFLS
jgi:hypothetical protein